MKQKLDRNNILEFIADLAGPSGPEIYAGYGSAIQRDLGFGHASTEELIIDWVNEVDTKEALTVLFDIAINPPGGDFYNNLVCSFTKNWEYILSELLYALGQKNLAFFIQELDILQGKPKAEGVLNILGTYLNESGHKI